MLRDPLAEPYTLGVSSGASVGAVIAICLEWRATGVASLAGAALVLLMVLGMAVEGRRLSSFTLLLTGVTMNSMAFAVILFLHNLASFSQSFHLALADGRARSRGAFDAGGWRSRYCGECAGNKICSALNLLAVGDDCCFEVFQRCG
jgi:iron complex transport system permease protein